MERQQFIFFIEPTRPEMPDSATPEERANVGEHFAYLSQQLADGTLILAGRTMEPPHVGIGIFEADSLEEAQRVVEADPAIQRGTFRLLRVQPYRVALLRTGGA